MRQMPQVTVVICIKQRVQICSPDNFLVGVRGTLLIGLK